MDPTLLLAFVSLALVFVAVVVFTKALFDFKFKDMDLKAFFRWLLVGFYFMVLPYLLFILRDTGFVVQANSPVSLVIYVCMTVVALCFVKAAYGLWVFSDRVKKKRYSI